MAAGKKKKIVHKSSYPIYVCALIWLVGTFVLPMYKLSSYLILTLVCIAAGLVMVKAKVFKDIEEEIDIPVEYATQAVAEICELAESQKQKLIQLDQNIDDITLSDQIRQIIGISQQITEYVMKNPESVGKTRKYFKYYVDSVIELLKNYAEFEKSAYEGENISDSKSKIKQTLDTSVQAFKTFYDQLYEQTNMDVAVDSKVLEDLFKQEGIYEENKDE